MNGQAELEKVGAAATSDADKVNPLRMLQKPQICGKPMKKCKMYKGRCLSKDECYRILGEEWANWVPNTDNEIVCKTKPGKDTTHECGCCYKSKKQDEGEEEPDKEEGTHTSNLQAIGLAVEDSTDTASGGFRLSLSSTLR